MASTSATLKALPDLPKSSINSLALSSTYLTIKTLDLETTNRSKYGVNLSTGETTSKQGDMQATRSLRIELYASLKPDYYKQGWGPPR